MQIFAQVKYLYKCLKMAIIPNQNLRDIITIVIVLDLLYKIFNNTNSSLLITSHKTIDEIQKILHSKETNNINKQTIRESISNIVVKTKMRVRHQNKKSISTKNALIATNQDTLVEISFFWIEVLTNQFSIKKEDKEENKAKNISKIETNQIRKIQTKFIKLLS